MAYCYVVSELSPKMAQDCDAEHECVIFFTKRCYPHFEMVFALQKGARVCFGFVSHITERC